ncbi:Fusaric acid resistance protein-like-domain-containing protein [Scheffersomyces coipomensis]|uniref:Fusaric acid resistance protein-like-domain-containing protein n=1 Tax=Scheffersomyces coipomensis TaxID=1788519 RepID=UPI00315C7CF0
MSSFNYDSTGSSRLSKNAVPEISINGGDIDIDNDDNPLEFTSFKQSKDKTKLYPYTSLKRKSTVIIASTGQKVRRSLSSISNGLSIVSSHGSENDPLLNNPNSYSISTLWNQYILHPLHYIYYDQVSRSVLKCSIAYLIASMGVYWTPFDEFLGSTDSKHVVATVAVYFHPTRSKGSMTQTLIYVVISLLFSFSVSFGCRLISAIFYNSGEDEISHAIDLIISSIALGTIAYMKQKLNKQTFNTACSLASISIVTCIVKEGSLNSSTIPIQRLQATFQVVVVGCIISVAICYLLWPKSAIRGLRSSLNDSYNIMSSALSILGKRFLTDEKFTAKDVEVFKKLKDNVKALLENLEDAKYELRVYGREKEWILFNDLVESTIELSKHIQALRSSVEMQQTLLHNSQTNVNSEATSVNSLDSYSSERGLRLSHSVENMTLLNHNDAHSELDAETSDQLFQLFVYYLSPSIKSFIFTLKDILSQVPFEKYKDDQSNKFADTTTLNVSLNEAIKLFETKQSESFERLYSQDIFKSSSDDFLFITEQEEITACCGNFASILGLYANELKEFLELTETYEEARSSPLSWPWLKIWDKKSPEAYKKHTLPHQGNTLLAAIADLQSHYGPRIEEMTRSGAEVYGYKAWKTLKIFRRTDFQFGLRVGLGAFCLSFFAYFPATKEVFNNWRGEWALAIYCIMMNKSLGGTTMTVKWRILGTFLGSFSAYLIWNLTDGNVYALAATGFLISIPSFYIILFWKRNNPFGRFILLTYNLTALYSYSMIQKETEDGNEGGDNPIIGEIAFHRFIAVSIGITWALVMASCFLPNSARSRLKKGLVILWLRLGLIWNSDPLDYDPLTLKLMGLKDEPGINSLLAECEVLLKQAPIEFRLKGSFPVNTFSDILQSTSTIIDAYQNMNLMIKVEPVLSLNEESLLKYVQEERYEVEQRIFLIFYMLASSLKLGFPLPAKPASIEHAKDRMLYKLSEVRRKISDEPELSLTNNDFILMYSYILVASSITEQLDNIISHLVHLHLADGGISEDMFQLV